MLYLYIRYIPKNGTMENKILFGILIVAIAAVGASAVTTVLDNIIQDVSAEQPKKTPPKHPGKQGGQKGQPGPEGGSGP